MFFVRCSHEQVTHLNTTHKNCPINMSHILTFKRYDYTTMAGKTPAIKFVYAGADISAKYNELYWYYSREEDREFDYKRIEGLVVK